MKRRIIATVLSAFLLLSGCSAPISTPEQEWGYDFGTTPENIFNGMGRYAVDDRYIYLCKVGLKTILEYDIETGETMEYGLPQPKRTSVIDPKYGEPQPKGNLFRVANGVCFIDIHNVDYPYQDEKGKTLWYGRMEKVLTVYNFETGESTPIEELGTQVFEAVPYKKAVETEAEQEVLSDTDNPLAGMEIYCFFGYDTFPEMAAQMAELGVTLEEPKDPNERNRYYVQSIGRLDGDTRQLEVLYRGADAFFVDEQYIYALRVDENGADKLYRSSREKINFQLLDIGRIGNKIAPYNEGFYFCRSEDLRVCWWQDGEITELPILSISVMRWRDQLVYNEERWEGNELIGGPMKTYNLNTGEIRDLGVSATTVFSIVGDRYLICEQSNEEYKIDILVDLETGEQKEIYRMERHS